MSPLVRPARIPVACWSVGASAPATESMTALTLALPLPPNVFRMRSAAAVPTTAPISVGRCRVLTAIVWTLEETKAKIALSVASVLISGAMVPLASQSLMAETTTGAK